MYKRGDLVRILDTGKGLIMDTYAGKVGIVANFEPAPYYDVNIWFEDISLMDFEATSQETWEVGLFSTGLDGVELAD